MFHQAGVKPEPVANTTIRGVTAHFKSLAHDFITLGELQVQLWLVDLRDALKRSAISVLSLAVMMALVVSAMPVLLLGFSYWLASTMHWDLWAGCLIVGAAACVLGLTIAWVAFQQLRAITSIFSRSQAELRNNVEFLKSLLQPTASPTTPAPMNGHANGHAVQPIPINRVADHVR